MSEDGAMAGLLDRLLRTPPLPAPPPEPGVEVLRPAAGFTKYRLCQWAAGHGFALVFLTIFFSAPALALLAAAGFLGQRRTSDMVPANAMGIVAVALGVLVLLVLSGMVVKLVAGFFMARLDARRRWYILGERTLTIREGIWSVREMTFTYANIQDIRLSAGILSRACGIAHLTVETAGGGGGAKQGGRPGLQMHRAVLAGLADAPRVRDLLLERQRLSRLRRQAPEATPPPQSEGEPLDAVLSGLAAEASALHSAMRRACGFS